MPAQNIIKSYLYQQYQNDLDLQAFVDAYNNLTQQYADWCNTINLPIYSTLSGLMLDWIGAGYYGFPRPSIGITSGAIYNIATYDVDTYGIGSTQFVAASDDIYKRILTWKLYRGDGYYMNITWLKKRLMRFLTGANGASLAIDNTDPISVKVSKTNTITITVNYPADTASVTLLIECMNSGFLDMPLQYTTVIVSA